MKNMISKTILVLGLFCSSVSIAQTTASFSAKSGDNELDMTLSEMNANAKLDLSLFKNNLNLEFGISTGKIDQMLVTMQPADVYMCLEVGKITTKPVATVVTCYEKNKGKGWGVIAKEMGIKPGSKAFHELKAKAKGKKDKMKKGKPAKTEAKANGNGNGNSKGNGKGKKK